MASRINNKIWWSLGILVVVIFLVIIIEYWPKNSHFVQLGNQLIRVEIASQPADWYQGLSDRSDLCADCGLLFNFSDREVREFVMRRMNFPLDIVFVDQQRVVKIAANLPPEGQEPEQIYSSDQPVDQVLEIPANYCLQHDIKVGDPVFIIK